MTKAQSDIIYQLSFSGQAVASIRHTKSFVKALAKHNPVTYRFYFQVNGKILIIANNVAANELSWSREIPTIDLLVD